jgi:hypothetical protein
MLRVSLLAGCAAGILSLSAIGAAAAPVSVASGGIHTSSQVELAGVRHHHKHKKIIIIKKKRHHHHRHHRKHH